MRIQNHKMNRLVALVISLVLLITLALPLQAAAATNLETLYPFNGKC